MFTEPLDALGLDHFVTGSVACVIFGQPRLTHDLDLVLALRVEDAARLVRAFDEESFYCPPLESLRMEARRADHGHFNLVHHATGFRADVYLKGTHPLHAWAFERRRRICLPGDKGMWVAAPEYVILRKLEFYKQGGSTKHLQDIRGILQVSGESLNEQEIHRWIDRLHLQDEWRQAQETVPE